MTVLTSIALPYMFPNTFAEDVGCVIYQKGESARGVESKSKTNSNFSG